ncbi:MAG: hypothetical protein K6F86_09485 [Lachnospiraceae bacterium]|nr:hypothetical protein [Lachnospiraceae bacterium]
MNKFSIPDKEERVHNLILSTGENKLSRSGIAHEVRLALSKYTNWDNLYLSENFKKKYKNRKNILEDVNNIADVSSGLDIEYGKDVIIIYAEKKSSIFDFDESDDITTVYYFRYILDEAGEIDDLILLEKYDVYTINGEPLDEARKQEWGWQE